MKEFELPQEDQQFEQLYEEQLRTDSHTCLQFEPRMMAVMKDGVLQPEGMLTRTYAGHKPLVLAQLYVAQFESEEPGLFKPPGGTIVLIKNPLRHPDVTEMYGVRNGLCIIEHTAFACVVSDEGYIRRNRPVRPSQNKAMVDSMTTILTKIGSLSLSSWMDGYIDR